MTPELYKQLKIIKELIKVDIQYNMQIRTLADTALKILLPRNKWEQITKDLNKIADEQYNKLHDIIDGWEDYEVPTDKSDK